MRGDCERCNVAEASAVTKEAATLLFVRRLYTAVWLRVTAYRYTLLSSPAGSNSINAHAIR